MTSAEKFVEMSGRIHKLEAGQARLEELMQRIEAKLSPPAPQPQALPKPPAWAQQSTNVGMGYCGPPSVSQKGAAGIVGVKPDAQGNWIDPFGQKRDSSGALIPHSIAGMVERGPAGPERSEQHRQKVELLDQLIERDTTT
jgi:hypothetical protein